MLKIGAGYEKGGLADEWFLHRTDYQNQIALEISELCRGLALSFTLPIIANRVNESLLDLTIGGEYVFFEKCITNLCGRSFRGLQLDVYASRVWRCWRGR
jgi:hypothetical protein